MMFLQFNDGVDHETTIVVLLLTNIIAPILTYLVTMRKMRSETSATDTSTALLKINKIVELMDKVEKAQTQYLELKDNYLTMEREKEAIEHARTEFQSQVLEVFAMISEMMCEDHRFETVKTRMMRVQAMIKTTKKEVTPNV